MPPTPTAVMYVSGMIPSKRRQHLRTAARGVETTLFFGGDVVEQPRSKDKLSSLVFPCYPVLPTRTASRDQTQCSTRSVARHENRHVQSQFQIERCVIRTSEVSTLHRPSCVCIPRVISDSSYAIEYKNQRDVKSIRNQGHLSLRGSSGSLLSLTGGSDRSNSSKRLRSEA